jgi:hypothetical protein
MEISQLKEKIKSRGHWVVILEPLIPKEFSPETHPIDKYKILSNQAVRYRGWPTPYFPKVNSLDKEKEDLEISEDITGGIDWEHYKEVFTLFNSGQFVLVSGVSEDWIDESEGLQLSEMKNYKDKKILSFVSTTYYFTEVFAFILNLINSDLYKDVSNFHFRFYLQNTKGRTLKIFGGRRVEFFRDYTATAKNIKICEYSFTKDTFTTTWQDKLLEYTIGFYKFFVGYEPNPKVIQSDIDNLLNRRF